MIKKRIVIDTSVLVSAFVFGRKPEEAVRMAFATTEIYVSLKILSEYRETPRELKETGKITPYQFELLVEGIATFVSRAKLVFPRKQLFICADKEDNMFLDCCLESNADFLITGDKKILNIRSTDLPDELKNLKIVNPAQFLKLI